MTDGTTPILRSINKVLIIVLDSFESLQAASHNAIDTNSIKSARTELTKMQTSFDNVEQEIKEADTQQKTLNSDIQSGSSLASGLMSKLSGLAASYLTIQGVQKVLNISDELTQITARLNLMKGQFETVSDLQDKIFDSAQRSRSLYTDTASAVSKLGILAGNAFKNSDEIIAFTELMNKNFKIGGASVEEQSAGMYQLTQAMASGRLQGDEFRSITENAPLLLEALKKYTGKSSAELRQMSTDGELTADLIKNAMFACADEINERFENIPKTFGDIITDIKNRAIGAFDPMFEKLNELANSDEMQTFVENITKCFYAIARIAVDALGSIISIVNFIADNLPWIAPAIMGIVGVMTAYKAILFVTNTILRIQATLEGIATAAKLMHAGATLAEAAAAKTATGAQVGLNAALLACPLVWIILLIIALIAAVYVVVGVINKVTDSSISATGVIAGGICWIIELVKNVGLWVANVALGIWGAIKACAENIKTAFGNAWINVQSGFLLMVNVILGGILKIINALNKIPGVNIKTSGLSGTILSNASKIAQLQDSKGEYTDIGAAFNKGFNTYDTFEKGWGSDAYNKGYEIGKGIEEKIKNAFTVNTTTEDKEKDYSDLFNTTGIPNYEDLANSGKDTADNTKAMADSMDITEEDLQYLRDLAEQEVINRFTTAEIKVDMTNHNNINSAMDLDGVVSYLEDKVYETMSVAAEGVHA